MAVPAVPPRSLPPALAAGPARAPAGLEFKGAQLGSTLASWKTSPFPGTGPIQPVCAQAGAKGPPAVTLSSAERSAGVQVCTYVYARDHALRADVPIGNGLSARQVRYVFRGGRLVSISYRASSDAFDLIVARIDSQLGAPSAVTRDQTQVDGGRSVQRVRMRWTRPAGVVTLTDPMATGRMSVVMATPAYASARPVTG